MFKQLRMAAGKCEGERQERAIANDLLHNVNNN